MPRLIKACGVGPGPVSVAINAITLGMAVAGLVESLVPVIIFDGIGWTVTELMIGGISVLTSLAAMQLTKPEEPGA